MQSVVTVLRGVHIASAASGLFIMLVPLFAKKGSGLHKKVGWAWAGAMAFAILTGIALAAGYLLWPSVFRPQVDPRNVRMSGLFLMLLGWMTASAIWQGLRAIGRRHRPQASRHPVDVGLPGLVGVLGAGIAALGLSRGSLLLGFFGATAMLLAWQHLVFALRPLPSAMDWWYGHMNGMLGAVIAAVTAFSVAGLPRLVPIPADLRFLPWIAPSLVLAPMLAIWVRYYRRRFSRTLQAT